VLKKKVILSSPESISLSERLERSLCKLIVETRVVASRLVKLICKAHYICSQASKIILTKLFLTPDLQEISLCHMVLIFV